MFMFRVNCPIFIVTCVILVSVLKYNPRHVPIEYLDVQLGITKIAVSRFVIKVDAIVVRGQSGDFLSFHITA